MFILMIDIETELVAQAEIDCRIGRAGVHGGSAVTFSLRLIERREATADLLGRMPAPMAFDE